MVILLLRQGVQNQEPGSTDRTCCVPCPDPDHAMFTSIGRLSVLLTVQSTSGVLDYFMWLTVKYVKLTCYLSTSERSVLFSCTLYSVLLSSVRIVLRTRGQIPRSDSDGSDRLHVYNYFFCKYVALFLTYLDSVFCTVRRKNNPTTTLSDSTLMHLALTGNGPISLTRNYDGFVLAGTHKLRDERWLFFVSGLLSYRHLAWHGIALPI